MPGGKHMNDMSSPATLDVAFREEGRGAFIMLNRPRALNALTHDMIVSMNLHYLKWAAAPRVYGVVLEAAPGRAFCVGGDIRALVEDASGDIDKALRFFRDEYQHNWTLECFTKPNVALIDGPVMGGGAGISIFGTHRVAGENFRFAMPETTIGFFPDIGGGWFMSRFPGETGLYLALTGKTVERADAFYLGVATHCIPAAQFEAIRAAMIESDPIDPFLDALHRHPGESEIARLRPAIDRIFSAATVEDILSRLDAETGDHAEWARETATAIRRNAPLSLKVTLRQLRLARQAATLKEALITDFRLAARLVGAPDFREGVRAALIDKDRAPKWRPAALSEVTDAMVEACFAPLGEGELTLKDHWTLID
jgi:enoyl-CoA hydratase